MPFRAWLLPGGIFFCAAPTLKFADSVADRGFALHHGSLPDQ